MKNIDVTKLTPEERTQMLADLQAADTEEKQRREREIEVYKHLVNDTVLRVFPELERISAELGIRKKSIRDTFNAVLTMKAELYGTKEGGQYSHQFMDAEGKYRIRVGANMIDNYDDTVNAGIEKVKDYINSLARDEQSQILVDTVLKLLSKDSKGTLKASRVLQLQQMADKSGNVEFIEGVRIIRNAYKPIESKHYIRAERRDGNGAWIPVPLGMTEAE